MTIVLLHGWGYDASLWDAVRAQIDPACTVETLDFGFFGAPCTVSPAPAFSAPVLAVGHSLGALWWLAQQEIPWRRLLCINGFARFTATQDYPGVAPRVLARMRQQFDKTPAAVLADFRARCDPSGPLAPPDPRQPLNTARLSAALDLLACADARSALAARSADVLALAGTDDPIVPPAMSAAAFAACTLEFIAAPGHVLPLTHPQLCARWIERLHS